MLPISSPALYLLVQMNAHFFTKIPRRDCGRARAEENLPTNYGFCALIVPKDALSHRI
jgi:hypothetical protein